MAFDESLANRLRIQLTGKKNVTEKKMFGGIGFLLHGNMMVGIWKKSLIVRLGLEEGAKALKEPFVRDFDITGRPMKGWAMIEPAGIAEDDQLQDWLNRSMTFVKSLPKKTASPR
jgi:TfoX/Sxy family transcriptional regulator of competence genes